MLHKYLLSLFVAVAVITSACSALPFVTRAQVRSGKVVGEVWKFELTIDSGSNSYYQVDDQMKVALERGIKLVGSGAANVISQEVGVTPQKVSWEVGKTQYTADGAAIVAQVQWRTDVGAANGARGEMEIEFPPIGDQGLATISVRSGDYQYEGDRCVVREVTSYQNATSLFFGQFRLALGAGLPFAILVHSIWWGFVVRREKRARLAALAPAGPDSLPRIFYPNPTAEWSTWTVVVALFAAVASLMASLCVYSGFMSSTMYWVVLCIQGAGAVIALAITGGVRRSVVTVRVDADTISYARGRGDLKWITARWAALLSVKYKSRTYRGTRTEWMELKFPDGKRRKIPSGIGDFPALRHVIELRFRALKENNPRSA